MSRTKAKTDNFRNYCQNYGRGFFIETNFESIFGKVGRQVGRLFLNVLK